jgi:hypothetical protein
VISEKASKDFKKGIPLKIRWNTTYQKLPFTNLEFDDI